MIGDIISELRLEHGMTQEYLSERLNIARSTLANWETNVNEPSLDDVKTLADLFNVSCDFLLERTPERINLNLEGMSHIEILKKINYILHGYNISKK